MRTDLNAARASAGGFSLAELAIVLVVASLLLGGLIVPLTAQVESRRIENTKQVLEQAKEALIGFAIANGRLPCPASGTSNGVESFCTLAGGSCTAIASYQTHGRCSNFDDGFLPAATLGLAPTDDQGYLLDAWGLSVNRIRYAVSSANANAFTVIDGMKSTQAGNLSPDLVVCARAPASPATSCGAGIATLAGGVPAIVFSLGKNAASGGMGPDEKANLDGDNLFVSHEPAGSAAPGGEFDDIVTWLSPNILYSRMLAAGRLP
jgi:type II secretory pathway pseudopilin PulG